MKQKNYYIFWKKNNLDSHDRIRSWQEREISPPSWPHNRLIQIADKIAKSPRRKISGKLEDFISELEEYGESEIIYKKENNKVEYLMGAYVRGPFFQN